MAKISVIHGWKGDDGKFYLSTKPWLDQRPANAYSDVTAALQEASRRHLPIKWEDPQAVDG